MTTTSTNGISGPGGGGTQVLGRSMANFGDNPFLRLLTEQLRNQTPLEPVDNESFMNQMASYSSMQQQQELNTNMLALLDYQGVLARIQGLGEGSALLGKEVAWIGADGAEDTGTVESVSIDDTGEVMLRVSGDREVRMRDVLSISVPDPASSASS